MKNIYFLLFLILTLNSCNSQTKEHMQNHKYTNHLINQTSPYLLQHAHNPVNWYPWGDEALEKAKKENKILLISIGYSACHWCHVMEHESFEDEDIAKIMNDNFVCIKVDREERPDIDQIYMDAVQLMTGRGGWPLNCFATPDGSPFYGGTYFPKNQWQKTLSSIAETWTKNPLKINQAASQIKDGLVQNTLVFEKSDDFDFDFSKLQMSVDNWKSDFDKKFGGDLGAPKFPMPSTINFLLEYYFYTKDIDILGHVNNTLEKISWGGIYDHIGGGFARYSTDKFWRVPHFEKMLYDNAQLIELYSKAYKATKNELFKEKVFETIAFVERELYNGNGFFFSSLDADSEGEEGKFYVWSFEELENLVTEQLHLLKTLYEISKPGNWEQKIIFHQKESYHQAAIDLKLSYNEVEKTVSEAKKILFNARKERIRPKLDDKSITSWNALMISGLCAAYTSFGNEHFLDLAKKNASHLQKNLINNDYSIFRNYKNKKASINGLLDDYAFTIKAFIELFQITGEENYFITAEKLSEFVIAHFIDNNTGMFFYSPDFVEVPVGRKSELTDGVIPSSNSVMAKNLFILSKIGNHTEWEEISKQMLANIINKIYSYPSYFSNWASLELKYIYPTYEFAICGEKSQELTKTLYSKFLPNIVWAFTTKKSDLPLFENRFVQDSNLIYVCVDKTCKMPVKDILKAIELTHINKKNKSF